MASNDAAVIATNDDATQCKRSAVSLGYWKDPFIKALSASLEQTRKPPFVHRGYFARVKAIDILTRQFLARAGDRAQIINLGAGFDSLYWRLAEEKLAFARVFDVDMKEVVTHKRRVIESSRLLQTHLGEEGGQRYVLIESDLRDLDALHANLLKAGLDLTAPTLVLSECVLIYLPPDRSRAVLAWIASSLPTAFCIIYEQINPADAFGKMMIQNLKDRGCPLLGITDCPTLDAQRQRSIACGFSGATAHDLRYVYAHLPADEVKRIEKIEWLDEFEEWQLFNSHYCISCAFNDAQQLGFESIAL